MKLNKLSQFAKRVEFSDILNSATKTAELTQPRPKAFDNLAFFPVVNCVIDVIYISCAQIGWQYRESVRMNIL